MCRGRKGKPAGAFDASHNHVGAGVGIQFVHDSSDSQREGRRNNRSGHNQLASTLNVPGWRSAACKVSAANEGKEASKVTSDYMKGPTPLDARSGSCVTTKAIN